MKVEVKGKELVIRMPLEEPRESKTGKTMVVASSGGPIRPHGVQVNGKPLSVNVSAFIPK